jgi:hypothetical protein
MTLVSHLEALLAALQASHIASLAPATRRRLSDALYSAHVLAEMQVTGDAFPRVRAEAAQERAEASAAPRSGVLAQLASGARPE